MTKLTANLSHDVFIQKLKREGVVRIFADASDEVITGAGSKGVTIVLADWEAVSGPGRAGSTEITVEGRSIFPTGRSFKVSSSFKSALANASPKSAAFC